MLIAAGLSACGGSGSEPGSLRLALTDAPACGFDAVNVTIEKVRVHQSASAGDNDAGWADVVVPVPQRLDLLALNNGVLAELGQTSLPAGRYQQLRLVLAANTSGEPPANSIVPTGGAETALSTPSGSQSGLKLNVNLDVPSGALADVVIDFDACKSVVKLGNSSAYNLKPVLALLPRSSTGLRVIGWVAPALGAPTAGTSVSLQRNGAIARATVPGADGQFVLYPVAAGSYDLVVSSPGRSTAIVTGVLSSEASVTQINVADSALLPPISAMGTASGLVNAAASPVDAIVNVVKRLADGRGIIVAGGPVDGDSGAFSLSLPRSSLVRAAYQPTANPLTLVADPTNPVGAYELAATAGGSTKLQTVDLTSVDAAGVVFTFP